MRCSPLCGGFTARPSDPWGSNLRAVCFPPGWFGRYRQLAHYFALLCFLLTAVALLLTLCCEYFVGDSTNCTECNVLDMKGDAYIYFILILYFYAWIFFCFRASNIVIIIKEFHGKFMLSLIQFCYKLKYKTTRNIHNCELQ